MKTSDVQKAVLAGQLIVVAEYRSFKPDAVRMRDKQTGAVTSKPKVLHSLEFGDVQCTLSEWLPDGVDMASAKQPFPKGSKVVLRLKTLEQVNFGSSYVAQGTMEPLEVEKA